MPPLKRPPPSIEGSPIQVWATGQQSLPVLSGTQQKPPTQISPGSHLPHGLPPLPHIEAFWPPKPTQSPPKQHPVQFPSEQGSRPLRCPPEVFPSPLPAPVPPVHAPFTQLSSAPQAGPLPHLQVPLMQLSPEAQGGLQALVTQQPLTQVLPVAHGQHELAPSQQTPPPGWPDCGQNVWPSRQSDWHAPPRQVCPGSHRWPQAVAGSVPQLIGSFRVSMQSEPQPISPVGQQRLFEQEVPVPQPTPGPRQLCWKVWASFRAMSKQ
jgi:hypothetical protein